MSSPDLQTLFTADDMLDEVMRARIWARLTPVLAPHRRWRWLPVCAGAAVVAAAAIAFVVLSHREAPARQLVAPSDGVLTVPLGPHTHAALVGPARLTVTEVGEQTSVELESGGLVAEFTGGAGRTLHVRARGVAIEIVGTVFSVRAAPDEVCLAVAHGRVKITSAGVTRFVGAGEQSCARDGQAPAAAETIEPRMQELLAHQAAPRMAAAPVAAPPPVVTPAPAPVVPPAPAVVISPAQPAAPSVAPAAPSDAPAIAHAAPSIAPAAPAVPAVVHATPAAASPSASTRPSASTSPGVVVTDDTRLYDSAEQAMARGDGSAAERDLAKLVADTPSSQLLDEALYDGARLAFDRHDWPSARHALDELVSRRTSPLREPGMYLRCRIDLASDPAKAQPCFAAYRTAFAGGPHDLDAGLELVALAFKGGGCPAVRALIDELVTAYPGSRSLKAWQDRCPR